MFLNNNICKYDSNSKRKNLPSKYVQNYEKNVQEDRKEILCHNKKNHMIMKI